MPARVEENTMVRSQWGFRKGGVILGLGLSLALVGFVPPAAVAQYPGSFPTDASTGTHSTTHKGLSVMPDDSALPSESTPTLTAQQKLYIVRSNFAKSKSDAAELAGLAKELRVELSKPNANVLSAEVTNRLDKIEKLAKKIRDETKGF